MTRRITKAELESNIRGLEGSCKMYSAQVERITAENKALVKENTESINQIRWLRTLAQEQSTTIHKLSEAIRVRS